MFALYFNYIHIVSQDDRCIIYSLSLFFDVGALHNLGENFLLCLDFTLLTTRDFINDTLFTVHSMDKILV